MPPRHARFMALTCEDMRPFTFETLLEDSLTRLLMTRDGVAVADLVAVLETARGGLLRREAAAVAREIGGAA